MEVEGQSESSSDQKHLLLRHQQTAVSLSPSLFSVYQTQDLVVIVNPFRNILFSSSSCLHTSSREKQLEQLALQIIEKQGINKAAMNDKGMMQFLIPGASMTFINSFPAHLQTWRGHPYHLFSLNNLVAKSCNQTDALGDGNLQLDEAVDTVILDVLRLEDVQDIQSQQTVAYEESYLEALVTQEPFCLMNACVRVKEGSKWRLASWCCTHFDLTIGLLATRSEYRQKGYGQRCLLSVISKQQHHSLPTSLAYIKEDNSSSLRLFVKSGFRQVDSEPCFWAGVEIHAT